MENTAPHPHRELIPAYAIGALDPDEIRYLEGHLETCLECQAALKEYQWVADSLKFALPPQAPNPRVRTELAKKLKAPPNNTAEKAQKTVFPLRWALLPTLLALVALLALNLSMAAQIRDLKQQQVILQQRLQTYQNVTALISQPGLQTISIQNDQMVGNLVIQPEGERGVLFMKNLPPLEEDQTYQAWLIPAAGSPVSAGLFQVEAGEEQVSTIVGADRPIREFNAFGITIEPAGGSLQPSMTPILAVNL